MKKEEVTDALRENSLLLEKLLGFLQELDIDRGNEGANGIAGEQMGKKASPDGLELEKEKKSLKAREDALVEREKGLEKMASEITQTRDDLSRAQEDRNNHDSIMEREKDLLNREKALELLLSKFGERVMESKKEQDLVNKEKRLEEMSAEIDIGREELSRDRDLIILEISKLESERNNLKFLKEREMMLSDREMRLERKISKVAAILRLLEKIDLDDRNQDRSKDPANLFMETRNEIEENTESEGPVKKDNQTPDPVDRSLNFEDDLELDRAFQRLKDRWWKGKEE